jgi:L-lactate dehydrogenase complex protein LldF
VGKARREVAYATLPDPAAFMELGKAIRSEVLRRLPELLGEFERNAAANGAKVFWAGDAKEANSYILALAKERGVRYVTKGKSLVTDEMGLNDHLEQNGVKVWETDLGEFIVQLMHRPPFHMVGPAINIKPEEIRDVFMREIGLAEDTVKPEELGLAARRFLRGKFQHLEMGITGVNFAVADTGTIINLENEGNIRFTKSVPRLQVSVMSLEKVVPTMRDTVALLRLLTRSCTGQIASSYLTMDNGPKAGDEIDGPEELHVVILDNGRSKMYRDLTAREVLRCIRCGACQNNCPVYCQIGGYPYGWVYAGPIGQILNPLMLGIHVTRDLYEACTLCRACKTVCPAGLDHPRMLLYLRRMNLESGRFLPWTGVPLREQLPIKAFSLASRSAFLWKTFTAAARFALNLFARDGKVSGLPAVKDGWFASRDLPAMPEESFRRRWKRSLSKRG